MRRIAFQFPGQGSQAVGMGSALAAADAAARATYEEADDALGFPLSRLSWRGPIDELTATENAQPALLAHSVAVVRALAGRGIEPSAVAGHSLGEFSAHVAAASLDFADALRLVRARGEAMARAGRERPGTMAAILGLEPDAVAELCRASRRDDEVLTAANFNAPGQIVVSGSIEAVARAVAAAPAAGARKAIPLSVSGAFHSPLMEPAAHDLEAALDGVEIRSASIPVVANVDGREVTDPTDIRARLLDQLTAPVRWVECVRRLAALGAEVFFEVGSGSVLTGLLRRIDRGLEGRAVGTPEELEAAA